ncbi:MAG: AzlD domain-containing protein [Betaproteobacteria bacterium]
MRSEWLILIAGMALVTYGPRVAPLLFLHQRKLPEPVLRWLSFIPVAILAALLAPSLVVMNGRLALSRENLYLLAALPTFLVAFFHRRSLFLTALVGMASLVVLRRLG